VSMQLNSQRVLRGDGRTVGGGKSGAVIIFGRFHFPSSKSESNYNPTTKGENESDLHSNDGYGKKRRKD